MVLSLRSVGDSHMCIHAYRGPCSVLTPTRFLDPLNPIKVNWRSKKRGKQKVCVVVNRGNKKKQKHSHTQFAVGKTDGPPGGQGKKERSRPKRLAARKLPASGSFTCWRLKLALGPKSCFLNEGRVHQKALYIHGMTVGWNNHHAFCRCEIEKRGKCFEIGE